MTEPSPSAPSGDVRETVQQPDPKRKLRKILLFVLKLAFSAAALGYVFRKVIQREGADGLGDRLAALHWGWIVAAVVMQLTAIGFATVRWRLLLRGQGIRPTWGFLGGSIMIARFWGAFTPGGFTGFGGWRIYDVARHTKKTARAAATIGIETLLGQVAFGIVTMAASVYGVRFIGTEGVLLVNGLFLVVIAVAIVLLARPAIFRFFARFLPAPVRVRVQTLIDAVCAYEGKGRLLLLAVLLGVGVHAFNNLIYVCAARALGVELGVGEVFFASSLQILATLVPASINGMGLRETAAVALYTSPAIGLPMAVAVLIPVVGFSCEMFVSAWGGLVFLLRRQGYEPTIEVDDADREGRVHAAIEDAPTEAQPRVGRGTVLGALAGLLGGVLVGLGEGAVVIASGGGRVGVSVLPYGALAYGLFCAALGAGMGFALALSGRWMKRPAMAAPAAFGRSAAFWTALFALALGAFRVRRDVFHEELVWRSLPGLGVLLACVAAAVVLYLALAALLRFAAARRGGSFLVRAWGVPALAAVVIGGGWAVASAMPAPGGDSAGLATRTAAPEGAGNVLFVVVDTLRADALPSYGYADGDTPNLDALARDAIRFDQAFANASWTRPSFASILTGRLPSNHGVMAKADALPASITTMPEALQEAGWHTRGVVTNYNVAPYFNFQQGFDEYAYLEPEFVLGAGDAEAKLLLVQFLRQKLEKLQGDAEPGAAYQDAATVNAKILAGIDQAPKDRPWFFFAGYMDPHDPYFEHPYSGVGYARAGHQHPDPSEAPRLRALYDGEITYWDAELGKLLASLKERGLYDDLTIVVTSDHGEEFHEHGGFWHGTTLYDEQVRVPLFVKLPESRRGGTAVRHWVQSIDLMPSLLAELGVEAPAGVQGGDIFTGTDVVYAEESHEGNVLEAVRERRGTDEWKLITANPGNPRGLEPVEVYRVDLDPQEQSDLGEGHEVREDVETLMATLVEQARSAREGAVASQSVEMDQESIERLCVIGYMSRETCCERGLRSYCD